VDTAAVPFLGRAVIAGYSGVHYLGATVWPAGLRAHYQRPHPEELGRIDLLAGLFGAIVLLNLVVLMRNRMKGVAAGLGAYAVLLAPVSGLTLTGSHLVADRYSHQPTMALGIVAAAALGFLILAPRRGVGGGIVLAAAGAVVLLLASHTFQLSSTWRDAKHLWWRVIDFEPQNWVAHEQLALIAYREKDTDSAAKHLEISLGSLPDRLIGTVFLANCLLETGRVADAERRIDHLLAHVPDHAPAWRVRGRIRAVRRDVDGAAAALEEAVRLAPASVDAIQDLADLLSKNRSAAAAEPWALRLVELNPKDVGALSFLGTLRQQRGDRAGAEKLFREAAAIDPSAPLPRMCLADLYGTANDLVAAERELRDVIRLDPAHAEGLGKLAVVLGLRGAHDEAAEFAVRAADAVPQSAEARLASAEFLAKARRIADAKAAAMKAIGLADAANDGNTARRARDLMSRL
jgi:tetratricopeptide (TPR) repeat protein